MNRAIHEDLVAVELLPESDWQAPSSVVLLDEQEQLQQSAAAAAARRARILAAQAGAPGADADEEVTSEFEQVETLAPTEEPPSAKTLPRVPSGRIVRVVVIHHVLYIIYASQIHIFSAVV